VDVRVPMGKKEAKSILKRKLINKWQIRWDSSSKLDGIVVAKGGHSITKIVGRVNCQGGNGKEEVLLSRLRLGRAGLNSTLAIMGLYMRLDYVMNVVYLKRFVMYYLVVVNIIFFGMC